MESTIVVSNSPKLFCLLPALPNSSGAGQGRSGVESSGEARMRAHRSNSSGRRTSPPLPASGRLEIVGPRRCSFRSSCKPKQYPRGPTPDFFLHPASRIRTPLYCLAASRLPRSVPAAEGVGMQTRFSVITGPLCTPLPISMDIEIYTTNEVLQTPKGNNNILSSSQLLIKGSVSHDDCARTWISCLIGSTTKGGVL